MSTILETTCYLLKWYHLDENLIFYMYMVMINENTMNESAMIHSEIFELGYW